MSIKFEDVMEAFDRYAGKRAEENEARGKGDGYNWGYFGHSYIKAAEDAQEEARKRLDAYIEQRIVEVMEERYNLLPNPPRVKT